MRVALYVRVSKEDGQTTENQLNILRPLAARLGHEIIAEYEDKASGKDPNRPRFRDMIAAAKRHEFDAIMAVRLDRIMRSVIHLKHVLEELEVAGISIIFADMEFDPNTPNGRLMINIVSAIAEWERDIISVRTKEGLAARKAKGVKLGRPFKEIPIRDVAKLRMDGWSWKRISDLIKVPKATLISRSDEIEQTIEHLTRSENAPVKNDGSEKEGVF